MDHLSQNSLKVAAFSLSCLVHSEGSPGSWLSGYRFTVSMSEGGFDLRKVSSGTLLESLTLLIWDPPVNIWKRTGIRFGQVLRCIAAVFAKQRPHGALRGRDPINICHAFGSRSCPRLCPTKSFSGHKGLLRLSPKSALFVVVAASPRMSKSKQGNIESHLYQESKPITAPIPVYILIPCCPSPPHFTSPRFLPGFFHPSLLALCLEQQKGMAVSRALEPKSQGPCAPWNPERS